MAKYGEDNARFLFDQLCNMTRHYSKLTFIEMGIEPDDRFEQAAASKAAAARLAIREARRRHALVQALLDGPWDAERFLVVPPGTRIAASFDERSSRRCRSRSSLPTDLEVVKPEATSGTCCFQRRDSRSTSNAGQRLSVTECTCDFAYSTTMGILT